MRPEMSALNEICCYADDPNWNLIAKIMDGGYDDLKSVLARKDKVIAGCIEEALENAEVVETPRANEDFLKDLITIEGRSVKVQRDMVVRNGLFLPYSEVRIAPIDQNLSSGVYLGRGTRLISTSIDSPAYISRDTDINMSRISSDRLTFIGENTVVSHAKEVMGCFISGGPLRENKGIRRSKTYMHSLELNNMIIGAYSGIAGGTLVHNHPQADDEALCFDFHNMRVHHTGLEGSEGKIPIFMGVNSLLGLGNRVICGSVIGAYASRPVDSTTHGVALRGPHYFTFEELESSTSGLQDTLQAHYKETRSPNNH